MNLEKKFQSYGKSHAFFYVTLDPERALGLEDILPNYTIICPYKSQLTDKLKLKPYPYDREDKAQVAVLEDSMDKKELEDAVSKGTYGILKTSFVKKRIQDEHDRGHHVYVLVLKNSGLIEDVCKKEGWNLLAPKAKIAEQFENKISQFQLLKNTVPYPETTIASCEELLKSDFNNSSQLKQVMQFNRGHSGNSTFFITSKRDIERLCENFPDREVKISRYIAGRTYTVNCLTLSSGKILTGSISEQITGLKVATNNPNTTCGNDFNSPKNLPQRAVHEIAEIARKVGGVLGKNGYRGLFGIDVIIENGSAGSLALSSLPKGSPQAGKIYFLEVNTHQPASVSFEAKLHRKIRKVPLMAYFILDCAGGGMQRNQADIPPILLPISAKQIIYRNKTLKILTSQFVAKKYKGKGLLARLKFIKPNEEIYRRQIIKS